MFDALFSSSTTTSNLSLTSLLVSIAVALVSGIIISYLYAKTNGETHSSHLATTLVFLPAVISVVIMMVGNNIAGAFSLAGLFTIIRFRSAPGSSKDILFILFCVGAGLAYGLKLYSHGLLFTIIMVIVLLLLTKTRYAMVPNKFKLKIIAPDDMNNEEIFSGVLKKYCESYALEKIGTKDLGSVYELVYTVTLHNEQSRKELIDEIRRHNGNMNISLTNGVNDYAF